MPCGKRGAVGGTFDKFHKGHRKLLSAALDGSGELVVGITSDEYAKASKDHPVEPFEVRYKNVERFVRRRRMGKKVEIVKLEDPYGPAIEDGRLEVLFVTSKTRRRGEEINARRVEKGFRPLELVEVPIELAEDGKPISSSRIRGRIIDTEGRLLAKREG
ncbi:MAG: pantetheine-phosphate adenylyltransferase [Candidatus Brockarchaeota archaeon]|nr:pantetheine-phosphate adenylyltransferase [Candidatus Brockarchaeota archaeon]